MKSVTGGKTARSVMKQELLPFSDDPRSHLHRRFNSSVHQPFLELSLDQVHALQNLSLPVYDLPARYLISQESTLHSVVDVEKGPVAELGKLAKSHKSAFPLLPCHIKNPVLRYPGWHVGKVGINTRYEQVRSEQVDLRLAALDRKLVVRHPRKSDRVANVLLQNLGSVSIVFGSENWTLEVLDEREEIFQMHPIQICFRE
ncbi:hypothetical protein OSB04_002281 [Centaurea solstitialis]|uniref:Uncharacterized protein n=1 Tax=Centaurea solstitialis TaxID=347529 RepID=A0AA38WT41_9ASTR|nr:hypothetical protein OSB04_002281 [Centaurea solstitialis]